MPIAPRDQVQRSTLVEESDFPLWKGVPDGWLRRHGQTRVLVIDDQITGRERLFGMASKASPPSKHEKRLREWLNVDVQFIPVPSDYQYGVEDEVPRGTFDEQWFRHALDEVLEDRRPVAAVVLDLLFGSEAGIEQASGPKFLRILRQSLPDVPVLILSNVEETHEVRGVVKAGGARREGDVSFQDYLPKRVTSGPDLLERLTKKLVAWADLSDPEVSAFSPAMRRIASQMRRIVLFPDRVMYEEKAAGDYPRPVLITGEVGSGKNHVADWLQARSDRRAGPYLNFNLAGHSEEGFESALFGATDFTGAATWYRVRRSDAAILRLANQHPVRNLPQGEIVIAKIGRLHLAHIADQPPGSNQKPLLGTLLIDEIGKGTPHMRDLFLGVFNRGRFTPHLGGFELPESGPIDVWFLVTFSPEAQGNVEEDLRSRLGKAHRLDVPDLGARRADVLPLAMQRASVADVDEPDRTFTREAIEEIDRISQTLQVRDILNVIGRLPSFSQKPPYSADEVRRSAALVGLAGTKMPVLESSVPGLLGEVPHRLPVEGNTLKPADPLEVLRAWSQARTVHFHSDLSDRASLRGMGSEVVEGAAAAILSFLDLCAQATHDEDGYSSTRTWNYFAGVAGTKTAEARTRIATLFLISEQVSLDILRSSEAILWLALDVAKRSGHVRKLVERIELDAEHADRVRQLRVAS